MKKDRERGKAHIGHFVLDIGTNPPVRQSYTAVAQRSDKLFKVLHMAIEPEGHLENWLDFRRSTNSWFIGLALLLVLVANGVPFRSFHRHFRDSWQTPPVNAVMLVQPEASQAG